MCIKKNKGQQEIVGFVLIVVIVMVALMVFLIISARDSVDTQDSSTVSNMLDVLMRTTTECAVVYEPDYDTFEELFKSCFKGSSCSNLDREACEYLNESVGEVLEAMVLSEGFIDGWSLEFSERDGAGILRVGDLGNCSGGASGAQRSILSGGTSLTVRLRVC